MAEIRYQGTLTGSDGSILNIKDATLSPSAPTGPTGATGATGPTGATGAQAPNTVVIGAASYPLTAINPMTSDYPGGRGPDQLVVYRPPITLTITNQFGAEVPVANGACGDIRDRLSSTVPNPIIGTPVPTNGFILSGHGAARDWLTANATKGAGVQLVYSDTPVTPPGPSGPTGPVAAKSKTLAVYLMMWAGSGVMDNVPSQCNEVRLAFAQSNPPALVGWTSDGLDTLVKKLGAFRAKGGRVLISIGGQGGAINTSQRAAFVSGITNIRTKLGGNVDGIDWDIEASAMNAGDVVAISTALKGQFGAGWRTTFAPNGGNVSQYLPAAVACFRAGVMDHYAQQFYDAPVSVSAALGRIKEAINAGLPADRVGVGMMIQSDASHWTVQQCIDNYKQLKAAVPGLGGAYLWETRRAGTSEWATALSPLVFG